MRFQKKVEEGNWNCGCERGNQEGQEIIGKFDA